MYKLKYIIWIITLTILLIQGCNSNNQNILINEDTPIGDSTNKDIYLKSEILNNAIKIEWNSYKNVKKYRLEYGPKDFGFIESVTLSSHDICYTIEDIEPNTIYMVKLTIIYNGNIVAISKFLQIKTAKSNDIQYQKDDGPKL